MAIPMSFIAPLARTLTICGKIESISTRRKKDRTNLKSSAQDEKSSLVDLHSGLRETGDDGSVLVEVLSERLSDRIGDSSDHEIDSSRSNSDRSHAVAPSSSARYETRE